MLSPGKEPFTSTLERQKSALERIANAIFETANEGIWLLDATAQIILVNPRLTEMIGYSPQEMIGKYKWDFVFPEDRERTRQLFERRKLGISEQVDIRFRTKDGRQIWILMSVRPIFTEKNEFAGALDMFSDVTERRLAEEAALDSKNRLESILNTISDGFISVDSTWIVSYINRQVIELLSLLGKKPEEVVGKKLWDIYGELFDPATETKVQEVMNERKEVRFEVYQPRLSKWFDVGVYRSPEGVTIYSHDITEQQETEEELRSSLREKEALLQEVHHRVKNNLQIITSLLALQANRTDNDQIKDLLRDSEDRVRAMALVHQQLYDESNQFSSVPFGVYVKILTDALLHSHAFDRAAVNVKVVSENISIPIAQAVPLALITNEIVSNSLKYAFAGRNGGNIKIELHGQDDKKRVLTVSDDGVGLPEGLDYNTSKTLGMRLIQLLSRQIDGTVEVKSSTNHGTSVSIEFPAVRSEESP